LFLVAAAEMGRSSPHPPALNYLDRKILNRRVALTGINGLKNIGKGVMEAVLVVRRLVGAK
jgi:hypothetical protein